MPIYLPSTRRGIWLHKFVEYNKLTQSKRNQQFNIKKIPLFLSRINFRKQLENFICYI